MIEVGWEPPTATEPEPLPAAAAGSQPRSERGEASSTIAAGSDEAVVDHYAAIQAGNEWAENQERITAAVPVQPPVEEDSPLPWTDPPAKVRAEGEHAFAPYSQLFSRLKPSADTR